MDQLQKQLASILETLVSERDFVSPIHVAVISANSKALCVTYEENSSRAWSGSVIAESPDLAESRMELPINLMYVNAGGDGGAAHVVLRPEGPEYVH